MNNVSLHLPATGRVGQKTIRYELCLATFALRPQGGSEGLPATQVADWSGESGINDVSLHPSGSRRLAPRALRRFSSEAREENKQV